MSRKIAQIKFFRINGETVIAPKDFTLAEIRRWYEKREGRAAEDFQIGSLTDKPDGGRSITTWADIIEAADFEAADLPMIL